MATRVLLNPASGRGRGARLRPRLEALARAAGSSFEVSAGAADLVERARRAAAEGVDRLLVAGGDGTWHWAAQGLAGSDTALAPIALGTGNDLARELGLPLDAESAFAVALDGERSRIDLGRLGPPGGRRFCGVAGVGFDAAVAEYARNRVRRLRGPAVYAWATLVTLARFRPPRLELESDGGDFRGDAYFVAFANTSHYGGGMRIAPHADPTDGRLEIVIARRTAKLRLLLLFPLVYRGAHLGHSAVLTRSASRASLAVRPAQGINADGESAGRTGPREGPTEDLDAGRLEVAVERSALAVVRGG